MGGWVIRESFKTIREWRVFVKLSFGRAVIQTLKKERPIFFASSRVFNLFGRRALKNALGHWAHGFIIPGVGRPRHSCPRTCWDMHSITLSYGSMLQSLFCLSYPPRNLSRLLNLSNHFFSLSLACSFKSTIISV